MTIFFGKENAKAKRLKNPAGNNASTLYLNNQAPVTSQALVCIPGPLPAPHSHHRPCPPPASAPGWTTIRPPQLLSPPPPPPRLVAPQPCFPSHGPSYAEGRWQGGLETQFSAMGPLLNGIMPAVNNGASCTEYLNRGVALCDLISTKLDSVITLIDGERFSGDERELVVYQNPILRGGGSSAAREISRGANNAVSTALTSTNYFSKANLYANSRLPPNLRPLRLYIPTYPLLCLAAQHSERVYARPSGAERDTEVDADWRMGRMMIKSVPLDHVNTLVFAIRGSQTFMDWAVNLNSAPTSPEGFLDDPGNLCHSGFLSVARKMIKPVAARLRTLLEEDPSRAGCSLLITGHSAGGAVASLLYIHMLSTTIESELSILTGCFKRIHCITFGTPPISLLPLQKPSDFRLRHSLFLSFINEGDPVPRADKAYVRSLLNLYSTPSPAHPCPLRPSKNPNNQITTVGPWKRVKTPKAATATATSPPPTPVIWKVPPATLSNAGRLVLLRPDPARSDRGEENVIACATNDQQLRGVMFGDPLMHMMKVYARRIETLATDAVLAKGFA